MLPRIAALFLCVFLASSAFAAGSVAVVPNQTQWRADVLGCVGSYASSKAAASDSISACITSKNTSNQNPYQACWVFETYSFDGPERIKKVIDTRRNTQPIGDSCNPGSPIIQFADIQFSSRSANGCPDNSTGEPSSSPTSCTCNAGWKPGPGALTCVSDCDRLKVISQGYYDIGTNPNADPKLVACAGHCQVVFDGYSPSASAMVNGEKHWFAKGFYATTGANCTPAKQETHQIGDASETKPEDSCPAGQTKGSINGKPVCYTDGGEEPDPAPDGKDRAGKKTEKSSVTNPDGSVTTTETTKETDSQGRETVTTTKTTTRPDGTSTTETKVTATPAPSSGSKDGEKELKTCGRPGEPKCAIDETGTPGDAAVNSATQNGLNAMGDAIHGISEAISATGGADRITSLPWSPTTLLLPPGSCSAQATETRIGVFRFDPCSSELVLLWRQLLGWLVYMLTLLYAWRSVVGTTGAGGR